MSGEAVELEVNMPMSKCAPLVAIIVLGIGIAIVLTAHREPPSPVETAYYGYVCEIRGHDVDMDCSDQPFTSRTFSATDEQLSQLRECMLKGRWVHIVHDGNHKIIGLSY